MNGTTATWRPRNANTTYTPKSTSLTANAAIMTPDNPAGFVRHVRSTSHHVTQAATSGPAMPSAMSRAGHDGTSAASAAALTTHVAVIDPITVTDVAMWI